MRRRWPNIAPRLQRAAEEAAALPRAGTREAGGESAEAKLTAPIAAALKRAFAALAKARAERHAAIDTPAEYRRAHAVCGQTRYRGVRDQVTT
jgi:hypothetical protein